MMPMVSFTGIPIQHDAIGAFSYRYCYSSLFVVLIPLTIFIERDTSHFMENAWS